MATVTWSDVVCPICSAQETKPCTTPSGVALPHPHAARVQAAARAAAKKEEAPPVQPATAPLYGYTATGETPHLVSAGCRDRSVCGQKLTWIPDRQPANLAPCKTCERLRDQFGATYRPPPPEGTCRVCGADERLELGLLVPHKQLVIGRTGLRRSDVDCAGAGHLPDGDA